MFSFTHVDPGLGYWHIIWNVNTRNRRLNLKNTLCTLCLWGVGWRFLAKPVFFITIFCGDLHFDGLIIGLCQICLVIGQTKEKVKYKRCLLMCQWRHGELIWLQSKWIAWQRVLPGSLGVGINYTWCLAIIVLFVRLGWTKRWGERGFKVIV